MGDEGQRTARKQSFVLCLLSSVLSHWWRSPRSGNGRDARCPSEPPRWRLSIREGRSLLRPLGARGADGGMRAQQVAPLPLWMCAGLMSSRRFPPRQRRISARRHKTVKLQKEAFAVIGLFCYTFCRKEAVVLSWKRKRRSSSPPPGRMTFRA